MYGFARGSGRARVCEFSACEGGNEISAGEVLDSGGRDKWNR
jgi:hypothetical protein